MNGHLFIALRKRCIFFFTVNEESYHYLFIHLFIYLFLYLIFCSSIKLYTGYTYLNYVQICVLYLLIYDFVRNCFVQKCNLDKHIYIVFNLPVDLARETQILFFLLA